MPLPPNLITGRTANMAGATTRLAKPRVPRPTDRMNKTEAAYAAELDWLKSQGIVKEWRFEAITLQTAAHDPTTKRADYYRPDFFVQYAGGTLAIIEIKGHLRDDAARKFKTAASLYPMFRFTMLRKVKGEGWVVVMGEPLWHN